MNEQDLSPDLIWSIFENDALHTAGPLEVLQDVEEKIWDMIRSGSKVAAYTQMPEDASMRHFVTFQHNLTNNRLNIEISLDHPGAADLNEGFHIG